MDSNIRRQLKDIQYRADNLLNGKPTIDDIEEFSQYNEELKEYLLKYLKDEELLSRVYRIPRVLDETPTQKIASGLLLSILMSFTTFLGAYFRERQVIEVALHNIREAKGNYASIEFLSKHLD